MADHISFDGQVTNIELNLARCDEAVTGIGLLLV